MTPDFLRNRTGQYLLYQTAPEKNRIGPFEASRIVIEPIIRVPWVRGSDDLGMLAAVARTALIEEQVPKNAPRGWDFELNEKIEQSIYDFVSLGFAGPAKLIRTEQVQCSPDQFKVDANSEDAAF